MKKRNKKEKAIDRSIETGIEDTLLEEEILAEDLISDENDLESLIEEDYYTGDSSEEDDYLEE